MIGEWRAAIVSTAKDPKDFGYIRDMYQLLRQKGRVLLWKLMAGYIFPQITQDAQAVMGPSDVLPSVYSTD